MKILILVSTLALAVSLAPPTFLDAQTPPTGTIQVDKDHIDFLVGKGLMTRYHIKGDLPLPYFWPLNAPDGTPTTRAWPMDKDLPEKKKDHPHHHSAWFTHGDVIPEGMKFKSKKGIEGVDFWTETKGTGGKLICTRVEPPKTSPAGPTITTHNEWRLAEGDKVLDETRKITFCNFGKAYLLVLDIDLEASVCPITFADTKEGTMAIRIHSDIAVEQGLGGKMQNAEGKINEKQIWGQKSAWCDYSGKIGNSVVGVAILDDPANPYPAYWHARDYGLMTANPFGRDKHAKFPAAKGNNTPVRLAKGERLHLRYGLLVHQGDAVDGKVGPLFQQFVKLRELQKQ
jgi:Methane oxygenase PmoA